MAWVQSGEDGSSDLEETARNNLSSQRNVDADVVAGFGDEWSRFDQSDVSEQELSGIFESYFEKFPWGMLKADSVGFDLGCGSGRWAKLVSERVGHLNLIDASDEALTVAKRNLRDRPNCSFHHASVDSIPLEDDSCDFGYSLGVLHHIPDTEAGLRSCVSKLKAGAPFLLYLYYSMDNRPAWFRLIWKASDLLRRGVCKLPHGPRSLVSDITALTIYFPLARLAKLAESVGINPELIPLSQYRNSSLYIMRNDALDRFGTRLEKRFSKAEIEVMMDRAGLERIVFAEKIFWVGLGYKKDPEVSAA